MSQETSSNSVGSAAGNDLVVPPLQIAGGAAGGPDGPGRRKSEVDRRTGLDRRQVNRESDYDGPDRRVKARRDATGLERRRGAGIRRDEERKAAEEGEMNTDQFEFVMAVEAYKKVNHKLYPTWTEILEVLKQLGYRKVHAREVKLENVPEAPLEKAA